MTMDTDPYARVRRCADNRGDRAEPGLRAGTSGGTPGHPGDEAPPGSPQTGEHICPDCHGEGRRDGEPCATCGGTGRIVGIVGDA